MSNDDDDPFAVFGDDSDQDDNNNDINDSDKDRKKKIVATSSHRQDAENISKMIKMDTSISLSVDLLESNKKSTTGNINEATSTSNVTINSDDTNSNSNSNSNSNNSNVQNVDTDIGNATLQQFPWYHRIVPLYINTAYIRYETSLYDYGGSRGFVVTTGNTIPPGTLLLIEEPDILLTTTSTVATNNNDNPNERLLHILYNDILCNNKHMNSSKTSSSSSSSSTVQLQEERHTKIQQLLYDFEYFHPTKSIFDHCVQIYQNKQQHHEQQQQHQQHDLDEITNHNNYTNLSKDVIDQVYDMIHDLHIYCNNDRNNENIDSTSIPVTTTATSSSTSTSSLTTNRHPIFHQIMTHVIDQEQYKNYDQTYITQYDIYRIVLVIRYNALQSGIYYYSIMFNHSDIPNCVKFLPKKYHNNNHNNQTKNASTEHSSTSTYYSEIRTTRTIQPGEILTISYIPHILSHSSRRHYLWQQHRFDIGTTIPDVSLQRMEMIHSTIPPSASFDSMKNNDYKTTVTFRIESAITELDNMYHDLQITLQQLQQQQNSKNSTTRLVDDDSIHQIRELEQASLELCTSSEYELLQNSYHILLIPCRRLHIDICDCIQQYDISLSFMDRMKLISRSIKSSYHLRILQIILYGNDHYDIARTNLDIVQGIEELLSQSTKHLFTLKLHDMDHSKFIPSNITSWTTLVYTLRKDYERIKALYPENASNYIRSVPFESTNYTV